MSLHQLEKRQPLFLKSLYLRAFRNYTEARISFGPKINVIMGHNAQGKTNLLEAISLISTGRSFRTEHLSELIQHGSSFFCLEAEIVRDQVLHTIKLIFDGKNKKLSIDANEFSSFAPLLGTFPSILSLPEDTDLITDSPSTRRRFLNLHLAQSNPLYLHHLSRFWRAMKQRNCLLKQKKEDSLDCWESEMAISAQYLFQSRTLFLQQLNDPFHRYSNTLSSRAESVSIRFQPTYPSLPESYAELLKKTRKQEFEVGYTLRGPHRDDLLFFINDQRAEQFASQGQKKTLAIALRFAQWSHLIEQHNCLAFMAIDDVGSMLDLSRQEQLHIQLECMQQVFLTTPSPLASISNAHLINLPIKN
jgi:DNA replication and repair protein RecF